MKHFALVSLLLLTGCSGYQPAIHPNLRPLATLVTTPYVEFMGDDQIEELVAFAGNPMWMCSTCAQGQTSAAVLAEVPAVIALSPNMVVVQVGAWDLVADPTERGVQLGANVIAISDAFAAAKIPAVVCMLPYSTQYDNYYFDFGLNDLTMTGIIPYVFNFGDTGNPDDTIAGSVDYTQIGLMDVQPAMYQEVEGFQLGGTK